MGVVNILDAIERCERLQNLGQMHRWRCPLHQEVRRFIEYAPAGPEQHKTESHTQERVDQEEARKANDQRSYDDQKATDKCLDDVP